MPKRKRTRKKPPKWKFGKRGVVPQSVSASVRKQTLRIAKEALALLNAGESMANSANLIDRSERWLRRRVVLVSRTYRLRGSHE